MSYLSRLKQLALSDEIFTHSPRPELTELTKAPFGGFVSTVPGTYGNISVNDAGAATSGNVGADTTAASFDDELFQERAAIYEFDAGFSRAEAERRAYLEVTK